MEGESSPACVLSLIIPAYNEAEGIERAVAEADAALESLGRPYEIIVVDDGSRDGTGDLVRTAIPRFPRVRLVEHVDNQGYGAALRTGFAAARGERIAFTDADCQFHLTDLAPLLDASEKSPIAVGYRQDRRDSWLRKLYSRGYNLLARALLDTRVRDVDCALKVFRREALAQILPESRGFFVNAEMLTRARQRHLRVVEVGVRHRPRLHGSSKVSIFDIPKTLNALVPFWWSRVMFTQPGQPCQPGARYRWAHVAILMLMAGMLLFGRLGAPLLEPEEARYAEIPRQMLAEGRFITPVLHGEAYYHKPPLFYWLVMGCYSLFGVHDWAARLVPCGTALLTVLVTYLWAARAVGRWAAFAGAAMLCLSAKFLYQAGMLTFDGPLCLFIMVSWFCAQRALEGKTLLRGWWMTAAVACGLGVLTKGPVALAIVVPPLVVWQWVDRRSARVAWQEWLAFAATATAVAAPWFVAVLVRDPSALTDFFWLHNVVRYVAPLDHEEPFWYYLPGLLGGTLPWSLLLVPFVAYLTKRSSSAGRRRPAALGFLLIAFVWCVSFFSLAGCKRQGYVLPAYPLLALMLGTFLINVLAWDRVGAWLRDRAHPAWGAWAHRASLCTLGLAILVVGAAAARGFWPWTLALSIAVVILAVLAGLWHHGPNRVAWRGWRTCAGIVFVLLLLGMHQLLPLYHRAFALRAQVRAHVELAQAANLPVASYPKRWDSISFYLERNDVEAYAPARRASLIQDLQNQGQTLLFVKRGVALDELLQALPKELEFAPVGRHTDHVVGGVVQVKRHP